MITLDDFIKILEAVEGKIDYEYIILQLIANYYRRGSRFMNEGREALGSHEYDKAVLMADQVSSYHKYYALMNEKEEQDVIYSKN